MARLPGKEWRMVQLVGLRQPRAEQSETPWCMAEEELVGVVKGVRVGVKEEKVVMMKRRMREVIVRVPESEMDTGLKMLETAPKELSKSVLERR